MFSSPRGRKGRLAGLAAAIPIALAVLAGSALPASALPEPVTYVALGDSYTAGQGSVPFDPATLPCNSSPLAYPQVADARIASVELLANRACAGASTATLGSQLPSAPDPTVKLVTLTLGGNDLGFSALGPACLDPRTASPATCDAILTVTKQEAEWLGGELIRTYRAVKLAYPKAQVVVLGYPNLFSPDAHGDPFTRALLLAGNELNKIVRKAAAEAGMTYVDVRDEFRHHELGSDEPWIGDLLTNFPIGYLHPTAQGQELGYLQALVNDGVLPAY